MSALTWTFVAELLERTEREVREEVEDECAQRYGDIVRTRNWAIYQSLKAREHKREDENGGEVDYRPGWRPRVVA